ncbi:unnamed protein product [Rotaria socialis]|nr:unnamed protein product [Rotaria socialis]CAF3183160.1 unnamed protein product [Rotaria socialis]CAF3313277.1 unnamed protein product [Rotaria socialis]CAF3322848.1 unnamed protein product [Rotaria socialis]CAF3491191.1 unnamed protein product [Rotaria socialis]
MLPAIRNIYILNGEGFRFVFDVTDTESFTDINDVYERNIPAILVGNKIDLAHKRRVTFEDAEQNSRSWSIRYMETSAKTKH